MARKLRRFKLSGLPRFTRPQVEVVNALLAYLPQTPFEQGFKDRLREVVEPLVHADIDLWLKGVVEIPAGELWPHLAEPTCVAVVALQPTPHQVLVEVDLTLAQQAIDRLLGGSAEDVDGQRPLSEIEEGVFSFILLRVLRLVQETHGSEQQLALKLAGVAGGKDSLSPRILADQSWIAVGFKLFFDLEVGFLKLYLPAALVRAEVARPRPEPGPALSRQLRRITSLLPRVAALRVPLTVELGRIPFTLSDLESIEPGDIVLIEDAQVRLSEGALKGTVSCRVGRGAHGLLQGSLTVGGSGTYEVAIEQILPVGEPAGGPPDPGAMDEEHAVKLAKEHPNAQALAGALREEAAARAARGDPAPLFAARDLLETFGAEHSDGEYGDEDGYEEASEEGYEEPLPESAGMLRDVTVPMVVELGRVTVSAADVVALRPGQVVELSRAPGDPVDLVVDGKRIGRGELVEIEGELGVRILDLAR